MRPPFLVCLAVLAVAAVLAGPVATAAKRALIKEPIALRKPLMSIRRDGFGPYKFRTTGQLSATIIDALGTDLYLSAVFEDQRAPAGSGQRFVHVDVTYYTGAANLVPHTADVCMRGAGYQLKEADNLTVSVPALPSGESELPVRALTFTKTQIFDREEPTVVYTFHCNGRFSSSRTQVRGLLSDPRNRHAYFCKVEVSFTGDRTGHENAGRKESIAAAQEFLGHFLPVLLREHLPDWEAAERETTTPSA